MRHLIAAFILIVTAGLLLGMGDVGGPPAGTVPETDRDFAVTLVDRDGNRVDLTRFSLDGKLFLEGYQGKGKVSVDFGKLSAVEFGGISGDLIRVKAHTTDGKSLGLELNRRLTFFGSTGYGSYQVRAADVERIEFRN